MQTPAWILKSCFAYSGGFALPSIRKICTLHRYEIENLALLKSFFHLLSTLAKMLNSRLTYSVCLSFFLLVNDLSPVSIWGLTKIPILQHMMVWKRHPECESALFSPLHCLLEEQNTIMHARGPVPHTCTYHAPRLAWSRPWWHSLAFPIVCKQSCPRNVAMLIRAPHDAAIYVVTATNANTTG